jgi:hypothetical protein
MAGRPSIATPEQWQTARDSIAAGVPYNDVARATGIPRNTIEKRASREKWHVPGTALSRARKTLAALASSKSPPHTHTTDAQSLPTETHSHSSGIVRRDDFRGENGAKTTDPREVANEKTGALVLQTLAKNEERASLLASNIALTLIEKAAKGGRHRLAPLEDVQDLDKALRIAKTANGSDKEDGRITVNLFAPNGSSQPVEAARAFRRKVVEVEGETL